MTAGTAMAKRIGRPKTSKKRDDVTVKFDRALAGKARLIAKGKAIDFAEYLSELARSLIDRDYAQLMREYEERTREAEKSDVSPEDEPPASDSL